MYDYIFLDLDGTLTDPGIGITNSVAYALKKFGIEAESREALYKFIGPPLLDSFSEYYGFSQEQARQAVVYYREYFSVRGIFENKVYPGIREVLEELKDQGKKLVLATSKPDQFSIQILKHFELEQYFCFVAASTMDETRTRKDEVIRYALEQCRIKDLSRVLMVGDRCHDIRGAKANGINSLGVLYGYGDLAELTAAGADYLAESPENLPGYCL